MARNAFDKKKHLREMDASQEEGLRKRVAKLRKRATAARRQRRKKLKQHRLNCAVRRAKAMGEAQAAFRAALDSDIDSAKAATVRRNAERKARRKEAVEVCQLERVDIEAEEAAALKLITDEAEEQRKWFVEFKDMNRTVRGIDRKRRRGGAGSAGQRRRERREESDDEVRASLAPHEVVIFNRVKRNIKGTRLKSRLETFYEWLEENPEELHLAKAAMSPPNDDEYAAAEAAWLSDRPQERASGGETWADEEVPF